MEINEWWANDPAERYWVEITDRPDLGVDLFAPTLNGKGNPYWGYELVIHVRPGDVVFHWAGDENGEPALVGWSRATGVIEHTVIDWQSHGIGAEATANLGERPAWRMPLTDYTAFSKPITQTDLRKREKGMRSVQQAVSEQHPGTLYYPFQFSEKRPLRASQTYAAKWPRALAQFLELDDLGPNPLRKARPAPPVHKKGSSGFMSDSVVKKAIEMRAVEVAEAWYTAQDYEIEYTGDSQPYDMVVTKGSETRRVEVKGSSGQAEKVMLTANEVDNAQKFSPVDLFVVDGIGFERNPDGTATAFGGSARIWQDWEPLESSLMVTEYRHTLQGKSTLLGELD